MEDTTGGTTKRAAEMRSGWEGTPLESLAGLPTRVLNWSQRRGVSTLGELVEWTPEEMLRERNLGRTSIRALERVIARETGRSWAELRVSKLRRAVGVGSDGAENESLDRGEASVVTPIPTDWDAIGLWLPSSVREMAITEADLPTRLLNFCASEGIGTLGQLFAWKRDALLRRPNIGRKSLADAIAAIRASLSAFGTEPGEIIVPDAIDLDHYSNLRELVRDQLGRLTGLDRLVLTRRVGFVAPVQTLVEIGEIVGVSRERIRQIQERAIARLQSGRIFDKLADALVERVGEGLIRLETFEDDPFFSSLTDDPSATRFFLERFTRARVRLVELEGEHFLTTLAGDLEEAYKDYRAALRGTPLPIAESELRAQLARCVPAPFAAAEPWYWELASADLNSEGEGEDRRALSLGSTRSAAILAFVRERGKPVSVHEITERFGRGAVPDGLIYAQRGYVVAPEALEGFERWTARIVPLCVKRMREEGPDRQWTAFELVDALSEEAQLPDWFGPFPLGAMLARSAEVRYLGRGRVALADAEGFESRLQLREAIEHVLEEAGRMLTEDEIFESVQARAGTPATQFGIQLLWAPSIVKWSDGLFGLVDRDLPGGREALEGFGEAVEEELLARQVGMTDHELELLATRMGAPFDTWPLEALKTAVRRHPQIQLNRSGSVGLTGWPAEKFPTRAGVLRRATEDHGGTLSLLDAQRLIERKFGTRLIPSQLALIAQSAGLEVADGIISLVAPAEVGANLPSHAEASSALTIPEGVPSASVPLFTRLLGEPLPPTHSLLAEARRHVEEIEDAHKKNEFIDPKEAHAIYRACEVLLAEAERRGDERSRRYAVAATRYFIALDDAESDFTVGGLDDDIAVVNAVAAALDVPQAKVDLK